MKQELETKLKEKYPQLLKGVAYFECDNGWYDVIDQMCYLIDSDSEVQRRLNAEFEAPYFVQIKEKFGGLRFYYQGGDDTVDGMVRMAESWAARTCEECGQPGTTRSGGWVRTLCDKHEAERQARMKEIFGDN